MGTRALPDLGRKAAPPSGAVSGSGDAWIGWPTRPRSLASRETAVARLPLSSFRKDTLAQRSACEEGLGLTMLPWFSAGPDLPGRIEPEPGAAIRMLVPSDLHRNPCVLLVRIRSGVAQAEAPRQHQPGLSGKV